MTTRQGPRMMPADLPRLKWTNPCLEKLNRLEWAAGLSFVSHGVRVGIRVNHPALLERLRDHLPPGWKPSPAPVVEDLFSVIDGGSSPESKVRRYHLLYWDIGRLVRTMEMEEIVEGLEAGLQLAVAVRARRRLFVRAAVVGWRGQALVVCLPNQRDRTALATALVRAGATYYSDQYALFDARGRVHPHPTPLTLRDESGRRLTRIPPEALGGPVGTKPLPVGLIALAGTKPGTRWRFRVLSPGRTVLGLVSHTVQARLRPRTVLATLGRAVAGAQAFQGKCGAAEDLVRPLLNRLRNGVADSSPCLSNS